MTDSTALWNPASNPTSGAGGLGHGLGISTVQVNVKEAKIENDSLNANDFRLSELR